MIHKKGSENVNADALSRAKHLDEPTTEENEEYQEANEVGEMKITFLSSIGFTLYHGRMMRRMYLPRQRLYKKGSKLLMLG